MERNKDGGERIGNKREEREEERRVLKEWEGNIEGDKLSFLSSFPLPSLQFSLPFSPSAYAYFFIFSPILSIPLSYCFTSSLSFPLFFSIFLSISFSLHLSLYLSYLLSLVLSLSVSLSSHSLSDSSVHPLLSPFFSLYLSLSFHLSLSVFIPLLHLSAAIKPSLFFHCPFLLLYFSLNLFTHYLPIFLLPISHY